MDCEKRLKRLIAAVLAAVFIFVPQAASAEDFGVDIVTGSKINLVSRESNIPIQIKNDFDSDVVVHLFVQPSNSKVIVQRAVRVKIPANTSITAKVPVKAIANGDVRMVAWLETFSGHKIGEAKILRMNVNAEIELASLIGLGSVVLFLLGYGVIRTRRKKLSIEADE